MQPRPFQSRLRRQALHAAAAVAMLVPATFAHAQTLTDATSTPAATVVTVVKVPKPWYAPRFVVVGKMRETVPQYAQLPGLTYKAFSLAREGGQYGGLYAWKDMASAKAWFSPAWFQRVRDERGAEAEVRFFDALVSLDNTPPGTPPDMDSTAVGTLVEIDIPAGVTRDRLFSEFKAAVPLYRKVPGLLRKHFTVSDSGTFGGIYIWKDEASANAWFTPAWHDRVRKTYGTSAKIEWFDTPILLPTQAR